MMATKKFQKDIYQTFKNLGLTACQCKDIVVCAYS